MTFFIEVMLRCLKDVRNSGGGNNHVIVAVQDSDVVLKYKPNTTLLYSTEERMFMVQAIRYVDEVVVYQSIDEIVKHVAFDILAVGPDQKHEGFLKAFDWCERNGKQVVVMPRTEGISSSELKAKIKNE